MVAALAGGVPVKGAPLLLTMRLHPMAVLATGVADPFESRRCPADPGHVALSPAPFTVGQALSRRAKAAIPLGATLRRWYRRRMAPRDQNSPSAVLAADGGTTVAAGGWRGGCLHRETRIAVFHVQLHSTYHRLSLVLHTLHGQQARVGWASPLMPPAVRDGASRGWPRRHGQYAPRLGAGEKESQAGSASRSRSDRKD